MVPPPITVRHIFERPSGNTPKYWFGGHAFETHFFNALSSTFPEGERFFIQSVRVNIARFPERISDPVLEAQVAAFTGQEGQHSIEHDAHVNLLIGQGYNALLRMNTLMRNVMRWFIRRLPRYSLAMTAAVEHITAVLAEGLMHNSRTWLDPMSPDMRFLWHWHAVEESEHKAVAFDVFQRLDFPTWLRRLAMLNGLPGLLMEIFMRQCYFLARDGKLFSGSEWLRGIGFLWGRNGVLRWLVRHHWAFYRSDFHPWQLDNSAHIEAFLIAWPGRWTRA